MRIIKTAVLLSLVLAASSVHALDHRNLDEDVPLKLEDAYPLKYREFAIHLLGYYIDLESGNEEGGAFLEAEYGIARNLQIGLSSEIFDTTEGENEGSGNLEIDVLYNFNTETMKMPAFAISAGAGLPTGRGEEGTDLFFHGIMTRGFRYHRIHINAGYTFRTDPEEGERDGFWQITGGWDHPAGLNGLVVAGIVVRQSEVKEGDVVTLLEAGYRRQISPQMVFAASVGAGLSGDDYREQFTIRAGISRSF